MSEPQIGYGFVKAAEQDGAEYWCPTYKRWESGAGSPCGPDCMKHFRKPEAKQEVESHPITLTHDPVNAPKHYTGHPSGVECIRITEHMNFCRGNALKYCFRSGNKENALQDLKKAQWYANRELENLSKGQPLRGVEHGECSQQANGTDEVSSPDQEWLHDLHVFLASGFEICPRDGAGDVRFGSPGGVSCLAPERNQDRQSDGESAVGERSGQHIAKEGAQHGTVGGGQVERQTDGGSGPVGEVVPNVGGAGGTALGGGQGDSGTNQKWQVLAAFITAASPLDRAVFYLASGEIKKARWYIDREIQRLEAK